MFRLMTVLLALLIASASLAAIPATVQARAPPQAACGVCTDALDDAASAHGVTLERVNSEMTIQVYRNGSTRWTARVTLRNGADALRDDARRSAIVSEALDDARLVADPTAVHSHLDGNTLVVTYWDTGVTERHLGVLVFTGFHAADPLLPFVMGGEGSVYPGADELVLRAPGDFTVTGAYPPATTSESVVHWESTDERNPIARSTLVTFVEDPGYGAGVRSTVARWLC